MNLIELQEQKFRYNFAKALNQLCSSAIETECIEYLFARCHNTRIYKISSGPHITPFSTVVAEKWTNFE